MQNSIQLSGVRNKIWRGLCRVSDWVDANLFPVPGSTKITKAPKQETLVVKDWRPLFERQADIEKAAVAIAASVDSCVSLAQTYTATDMVRAMRAQYGPSTQMDAAVASLMLRIYNRQVAIIHALG